MTELNEDRVIYEVLSGSHSYGLNTPEDVTFLVKKLNKLGFKSARQLSNNTIRISTYSTKNFLDYIRQCPYGIKNLYGYKWKIGVKYENVSIF